MGGECVLPTHLIGGGDWSFGKERRSRRVAPEDLLQPRVIGQDSPNVWGPGRLGIDLVGKGKVLGLGSDGYRAD